MGTADDGAALPALTLQQQRNSVSRPRRSVSSNPDFPSDYYTWEMTARKRMTNRWSLLASFARAWLRESRRWSDHRNH